MYVYVSMSDSILTHTPTEIGECATVRVRAMLTMPSCSRVQGTFQRGVSSKQDRLDQIITATFLSFQNPMKIWLILFLK